MAFNFNWSPLIADTSRARDMLTNALNKTPKPPIIVGDIIVTELNLGSVPPELEILEIGDLAEDRFRGIFKMSYTGDAYLTLRTRVQANPLNTYLSSKPSFASPQPLAASSGLTIPLQINLSDVRMSGFVILVFSRQKGITLVFRNDPLESLKVSSTFDSIPFVRDYLQKEIEAQLRVLFMDDLPAIIHRLSMKMCAPDYQHHQDQQDDVARAKTEIDIEEPVNPLASPPQNPIYDTFINPLDDTDLASLSSPETSHQTYATFSRRNLLRLATLTDSHRTLSLFTPPIRDAVFRAWAGAAEKGEIANISPLGLGHGLSHPGLSRAPSATTSRSGSIYSFSDAASAPASSAVRPSVSSMTSAYSFSNASRAGGRPNRKRKHRIVDLRRPKPEAQPVDAGADNADQSRPTTPTSASVSSYGAAGSASEPREGELTTPPDSPEKLKTPRQKPRSMEPLHSASNGPQVHSPQPRPGNSASRLQSLMLDDISPTSRVAHEMHEEPHTLPQRPPPLGRGHEQVPMTPTKAIDRHGKRPRHLQEGSRTHSLPPEKLPTVSNTSSSTRPPAPSGGILEQAWMQKMATEIQLKVREEKMDEARSLARGEYDGADERTPRPVRPKARSFWTDGAAIGEGGSVETSPPPAYAA